MPAVRLQPGMVRDGGKKLQAVHEDRTLALISTPVLQPMEYMPLAIAWLPLHAYFAQQPNPLIGHCPVCALILFACRTLVYEPNTKL